MMQRIIPSIMAKNQKELHSQLKIIKQISKNAHLDVSDGHFAPSKVLWFKFKLVKKIAYSVHLMVENPEWWIKHHLDTFDLFLPHIERLRDINHYYEWITKQKKPFCFALLPETKISSVKRYVKLAHTILILTVHPGFYGSKFLPSQIKKIKKIKKINPSVTIIVDGGMNPKTILKAKKAGGDLFISGSFVMKSDDPKKAMKELNKLVK